METKPAGPLPFPIPLLLLDLAGTVFLGLGAAKLAGFDLLPWKSPIEAYGIPFVLIGIVLMAPFVLHVVKRARPTSRS